MTKALNNAPKRLAQAAVLTLAITGVSVPSFALEPGTTSSFFTIDVQEPSDPCELFTPYGATWAPDTTVTLTDQGNPSNTNAGAGSITVGPGASVGMQVNLNFSDGSSCNPADGSPVNVAPDGTVSATWTMPNSGDVSLDTGSNTCDVSCSAASTTSIVATALVAASATTAMNSGSVSITWVPAP